MAIFSSIQWCDSSANLQMGCEGCELSSKAGVTRCYAEQLTNRYAGKNSGFPSSFMQPKIFMDRLPKIIKWPSLTGTQRPDKPWLNKYPRMIFLNDMGDTFSRGMPADWFAAALPAIASSPHIYLVLTKWPSRFVAFSRRHPLPANVWPGTSVTSQKTLFRAKQLAQIQGGGPLWISAEPQWGTVDYSSLPEVKQFKWIIFGGESGTNARPCMLKSIQSGIDFCRSNNISPFVKQLGAMPIYNDHPIVLKDGHGGNWDEWPKELRVRELPKIIL